MNLVVLMGRSVRETEIRHSNDMTIAKLTLAVDRRGKDKEADFISCTAFGKTAEFCEKYIKKGTKVVTQGRWQTGSYTNKDGQKVYTNDCIIDQIEFAESKKSEDQTAPAAPKTDDFMNLPTDIDDVVPFG